MAGIFGLQFGGDSTSQSSSNPIDNSQAFSQSQQLGGDLLQLAPSVSLAGSGTLNLATSDYGAISAAGDLLKSGLSGILNAAANQGSAANETVKGALGLANKITESGAQTLSTTVGSAIKWISIGAALYFGFKWLSKGDKKGAASA